MGMEQESTICVCHAYVQATTVKIAMFYSYSLCISLSPAIPGTLSYHEDIHRIMPRNYKVALKGIQEGEPGHIMSSRSQSHMITFFCSQVANSLCDQVPRTVSRTSDEQSAIRSTGSSNSPGCKRSVLFSLNINPWSIEQQSSGPAWYCESLQALATSDSVVQFRNCSGLTQFIAL